MFCKQTGIPVWTESIKVLKGMTGPGFEPGTSPIHEGHSIQLIRYNSTERYNDKYHWMCMESLARIDIQAISPLDPEGFFPGVL